MCGADVGPVGIRRHGEIDGGGQEIRPYSDHGIPTN